MTPGIKEAILQLWEEVRNPLYIAQKLGIADENGKPDTEKVLCVVEDPANYPSWGEFRRSIV